MGGTSSKPVTIATDYSQAQFSASDVERQMALASAKLKEETANAISATSGFFMPIVWTLVALLVLGIIGFVIYYFVSLSAGTLPDALKPPMMNVTHASSANGTDITSLVVGRVVADSLYIPASVSKNLIGTEDPNSIITINYSFSDDNVPRTLVVKDTDPVSISLANRSGLLTGTSQQKPVSPYGSTKSGPTFFSKLRSMFSSGNSGDQLPYAKDATSVSSVPAGNAPLSDGADGAYGMQFWMYVKDWNTNFGKEKHILSRSDVTNSSIMNPNITLHPTENTMRVSISVFPTGDASSKTEPAPAGHSGSTDDVFSCEVPGIPLQSWVSVSLTVFSRNLDIYINGKLVKSCLLSGVPKKALGDIIMNKDGGFSGYVCGFYHYPRMLVPADAQAFFSAGTSCSSTTAPTALTKASGYGVKFGVYDATGKVINQYVF
jgi:hypothetical protein